MNATSTVPALVFDFDNTITRGDMLDELIEAFSPDDSWRRWEDAWRAGRMSARDCLRRQIEAMRVSRDRLLERAAKVGFDPAFVEIVAWARRHAAPIVIVSDSFAPIIEHVLGAHGIAGVPVFANALSFAGDRLVPSFPYYDEAFPRSGNAKARHLRCYAGRPVLFAGDGRSDFDAALCADVVFAKDALAAELEGIGRTFRRFDTLQPILDHLRDITPAMVASASRQPV